MKFPVSQSLWGLGMLLAGTSLSLTIPATSFAHPRATIQGTGGVQRVHPHILSRPLTSYVRHATDFVLGYVESSSTSLTAAGFVVTDYSVVVEQSMRGALEGTLTVSVMGGEHDGSTTFVDGAPSYAAGESFVGFLVDMDGTLGLLGLGDGAYELSEGAEGDLSITGKHAPEGTSAADFMQQLHDILAEQEGGAK